MNLNQNPMPYGDWMAARRSIRSFQNKPVPLGMLERIIDAACLSPSAHNIQPWRFMVFQEQAGRARLAGILARRLQTVMVAEGQSGETIIKRMDRTMRRFTEAPAAVLVCCEYPQRETPERESDQAEKILLIQSVASAMSHLLLAVHGEGLGACWIGYPAFCPAELFSEIGLPLAWEPQAAVLLGYPDEEPKPPNRLPRDRIVIFAG